LHEQINDLFESRFSDLWQDNSDQTSAFNPSFDIDQNDDEYEITLELAGVKRDNVSIEVREDTLTITGSKEDRKQSDASERAQSSRRFGRFTQSLSLPGDADQENISANFEDGVLTVRIPRDAERDADHVRRIEVDSGAGSSERRAQTIEGTTDKEAKGAQGSGRREDDRANDDSAQSTG